MSSTAEPEEGTVRTFERTFTHEDVEQFGEVSGDQQTIHTQPDEQGRLVVQGLLTATLPTKIGGDLGVLAHSMEFEFVKPVYTGESITCEVTTETVEERDDRYDIASSIVCHREDATAARGEADREDDTATGSGVVRETQSVSRDDETASPSRTTTRDDDIVLRGHFEGLIWKE